MSSVLTTEKPTVALLRLRHLAQAAGSWVSAAVQHIRSSLAHRSAVCSSMIALDIRPDLPPTTGTPASRCQADRGVQPSPGRKCLKRHLPYHRRRAAQIAALSS